MLVGRHCRFLVFVGEVIEYEEPGDELMMMMNSNPMILSFLKNRDRIKFFSFSRKLNRNKKILNNSFITR